MLPLCVVVDIITIIGVGIGICAHTPWHRVRHRNVVPTGMEETPKAALAFAGPVCLGGVILRSSSPCPIILRPFLPQRGEVDPWLLRLPRPQEAAASICCSLWEGVLVGAVDTPLQAYRERSSLLRRQSLRAPATPLLPGSIEGRLPCKYTGSPCGSKSGNTLTWLPSRASRVGLWP